MAVAVTEVTARLRASSSSSLSSIFTSILVGFRLSISGSISLSWIRACGATSNNSMMMNEKGDGAVLGLGL